MSQRQYLPRLPKGYTRKPCPGCGDTSGHEAGSVCTTCQTLLSEARAAREAAIRGDTGTIYASPFDARVHPYFHRGRSYHADHIVYGRLGTVVGRLIRLCGKDAPIGRWNTTLPDGTAIPRLLDPPDPAKPRHGVEEYAREKLIFDPAVAETIRELDQAIRRLVEASYEDGYEQGQNLLERLAEGTISVEDFNKYAVAGAKHS